MLKMKMGKFRDLWNTDKDGKNGGMRSFLRYGFCITAAFVLLVGFISTNSVLNWIRAGVEIRRQEKRIEYYQKDIEKMNDQIHALKSNKDSLERFARENFNFAEPGDDVFITE